MIELRMTPWRFDKPSRPGRKVYWIGSKEIIRIRFLSDERLAELWAAHLPKYGELTVVERPAKCENYIIVEVDELPKSCFKEAVRKFVQSVEFPIELEPECR